MFSRWWSGGICDEFKETSTSRSKELDMPNVAGIFLILAGGIVLAILACLIEVIVRKIKEVRTEKVRT